MSPRFGKVLPAIAFIASATPALAVDGPECFSKYVTMNVCEYARSTQAKMAELLPMKLSSNITIVSTMAVSSRLTMIASFQMTKAAAETLAAERGITMTDWNDKIVEATRNSVCSDKTLSAFVRLGGQVQYTYKTLDGFPIFQPEVTGC